METAKVFFTGGSQAIRLPRKFRFDVSEVAIQKRGNQLILTPISRQEALEDFLAMPQFPDFSVDRGDSQNPQPRELFG